MLDEGVLEASGKPVDYAYAMHVMSNRVPSGMFVSRKGTIMSASHHLNVTVIGKGGHGSAPDAARDPIVATAEMITSLQTAVIREFDIFDPVVITVGVINGGVAQRDFGFGRFRGNGSVLHTGGSRTPRSGDTARLTGCCHGPRSRGRHRFPQ